MRGTFGSFTPYSACRAAERKSGAVVRVMDVSFDSISAAQRAAPTVLVKLKKMPAKGIISRRVATVPNLVFQVSGQLQNVIIGLDSRVSERITYAV